MKHFYVCYLCMVHHTHSLVLRLCELYLKWDSHKTNRYLNVTEKCVEFVWRRVEIGHVLLKSSLSPVSTATLKRHVQ